jgi:branched-chain amino acid transport system permease protein
MSLVFSYADLILSALRARTSVIATSVLSKLPIFALLAITFALPFYMPNSYYISRGALAAIYAIATAGLFVTFSLLGQITLAHAALWGVGAYSTAIILRETGWAPWTAILAAMALSSLGAVLLQTVCARVHGFVFATVSFGAAEIARLAAHRLDNFTGGSGGISLDPSWATFGPIAFDPINHLTAFYLLVALIAWLSIGAVALMRGSIIGCRWVAIRENEPLAASVGIDVVRYKLLAAAVSGFLAGMSGAFFAFHQLAVQPDLFTPLVSVQFLLILLIAGKDSIWAPIVGSTLFVFGPDLLYLLFADVFRNQPQRLDLLFGLGLILGVLRAPRGLIGEFEKICQVVSALVIRVSQKRRRMRPERELVSKLPGW